MAQLSYQQLLDKISKRKPVPAILLLGSELFLRDSCKAALIEVFVPENAREWGVSRFSSADGEFDDALSQAQTLPMLCPHQVIFLDDFEALEKLRDDARDRAAGRLAAYLDDPAPFTTLVLMADKLDQRMRLGKLLAEKALVAAMDLGDDPEEKHRLAASLAAQMAKEMGAELERDAAEELADILNAGLLHIHSEIAKLVTHAGGKKRVTLQDVQALVVGEQKNTVWQLAEILAARQPQEALEFLDGVLREGEEPAGIIGAIAWMFRKLLEAQELPVHSIGWQAARSLGMRPEMAELALRNSRKIPRAQLLQGLQALYEADSRVKSGGTSQRAVMEFLAVKLAASQAAGRP